MTHTTPSPQTTTSLPLRPDTVQALTPLLDMTLTRAETASIVIPVLEPNPAVPHRNITVDMEADSTLDIYAFILNPGDTEVTTNITVNLNGPGANCRIYGISILNRSQKSSININVNHNAPDCASNQLVKYIVAQDAIGTFHGTIKVTPNAVKTRAYQNNRNILADPSARMISEPQLEIYCDDVQCSHGAATGQLDQQAIFYMRTRGIDLVTARSMLMNAFMSDIIKSYPDTDAQETLTEIISRRLDYHTNPD